MMNARLKQRFCQRTAPYQVQVQADIKIFHIVFSVQYTLASGSEPTPDLPYLMILVCVFDCVIRRR